MYKKISFIISLCCAVLALEARATVSFKQGTYGTWLLTMTNQEAQNYSKGQQPFKIDGQWFKFVGFRMFDLPSMMNNYMSLELPKIGSKATYRLNYSSVVPAPKPIGKKPNPHPEEKDRIIEFTIERVSGPGSKLPVPTR